MNKFSFITVTSNYLNTSCRARLERVCINSLNLASCIEDLFLAYLDNSYKYSWNDLKDSEIVGIFIGLFMTKRYMKNNVIKWQNKIAGQLNTPTAYSRLETERTTLWEGCQLSCCKSLFLRCTSNPLPPMSCCIRLTVRMEHLACEPHLRRT